jgi:signal transduction histidine kinase
MYLQSKQGAVAVESSQEEPVAAGDSVEVVGFISRREGSPVIEDAVWRSGPAAPAPGAQEITAEQALSGDYDARLVSMKGLLLESSRLAEGPTLVLQSGTKVFLARFVEAAGARRPPSMNENSWLRVTGICLNGQVPQLRGSTGPSTRRTFHLLLSGPEAVEVARAPNWWTLRRMLMAFGALLALAAAAFAWVMVLRRRVAKQTGEIREHLARETLFQERVRIARELHDSLEQDLVGISMQLKATERLLVEPDRARSALHLASAMVRRSQAETHRAVWDLREPVTDGAGLGTALHSTLAMLAPEDGPEVQIRIAGIECPLPPQAESHLLRIAAEAVTNARKHSAAGQVRVDVRFEEGEVRLTISDDGKGFDSTRLPPPHAGHFGLFGMRERVEKLGGHLQIHSEPGKGTRIEVVAPCDGAAVAAIT